MKAFINLVGCLVVFGVFPKLGNCQVLPTAAFVPFTFSESVSSTQSREVYGIVKSLIQQSGRFQIVEHEKLDAIQHEMDLQRDAMFLNGLMIEQSAGLGAEYLILGHVIDVKSGVNHASMELAIVDVATTEVLVVEKFSANGRQSLDRGKLFSNETTAMASEVSDVAPLIQLGVELIKKRSIQRNIKDFLNEHFPIQLMITDVEISDDEVQYLELYGRKVYPFRRGENFSVVETILRTNEDGSVGKKEIEVAKIKVTQVNGDYALCKVIRGKEDLFAKHELDNLTVQYQ
ncbi:CsgG/HfaB family protein [Pontibacter sp. G13]|uniref:CsgG/HfaB family protein n=1 Tax=Pontibacter sp. G13 TaxID=3074898 RepID=UPI00288B4855|nr:CsgG/HfaB family protein [Pontibacter sp. G13]WNJ17551.1 CsgG/HfaB family protein [Pontibacter sp. G13]